MPEMRSIVVRALALLVAAGVAARAQTTDPVVRARQLALHGKRGEATAILQRVLSAQPDNLDAVVVLAYVDMWSGHPARANERATAALAANPDYVDLLVVHAQALRQLNREPEAFTAIERARALAPQRADVRELYDRLRFDVHGGEIDVVGVHESWSDGRDPWREGQLVARQNSVPGTGVLAISRASRFGASAEQLDAELYPRLPFGYMYIGGTFATNAALYARSSFGAELFASVPPRFEASAGVRRLNFAEPLNVLTASAGMYEGDYLFSARLNHVTGSTSGTSAALSTRRYLQDGMQYVGLVGSAGSVRQDLRTQSDVLFQASRLIAAEALLLVRNRWAVTPRIELGHDETRNGPSVDRVRLTLGIGHRF